MKKHRVDRQRLVMLAMKAEEGPMAGTDIGFTMKPRQSLDMDRLYRAYSELVAEEPALRSVLRYDDRTSRWRWAELNESVWRDMLAREQGSFSEEHDVQALASTWHKLESDFPFRLFRLANGRLYGTVQHALTDAAGGMLWIGKVLARYELLGDVPQRAAGKRRPPVAPSPAIARKRLAWLPVFLLSKLPIAHLRAHKTVDLTHGRAVPPSNHEGYSVDQLVIAGAAFTALKARAWEERLTLTQLLTGILSEVLLEGAEPGTIARIGLPIDLRPETPMSAEHPMTMNFVQTFPVEIVAGRPWREQITREYRWIKRGVPAMLGSLISAVAGAHRGDQRVVKFLAGHLPLRHSHPARGYLMQWTCLLSSIEGSPDPTLEKHLAEISVHGKFEFLGFGVIATGSTLTIDVSAPNHIYPRGVTGRLLRKLQQRIEAVAEVREPLPVAAGVRAAQPHGA
jgi:hypothetical protein